MIFDQRRLRYKGGPRSFSKKLGHRKRAAFCRYVMRGYPIENGFISPEDVWTYLKADRITCLRCGKAYKALGSHIQIHGWDAERYRRFYGLPWNTGLTSSSTRDLQRRIGKESVEAGIAFAGEPGAHQAKACKAPRRKQAPYLRAVKVLNLRKKLSVDHAPALAGELRLWLDEDYWSVLDRMTEQDRTATDVCGDHDMPGRSVLRLFSRDHPEFSRALEAASERLTFPVQANAQRLGRRFRKQAIKLRKKGLTNKQIGETLGVHFITVRNQIAGVPYLEKTHCPKGHPYSHDGPKKCKICNTEHARRLRGHMVRSESAKTPIRVSCYLCRKPVVRSRLWGRKRKARCHDCYLAYHREYNRTPRRPHQSGVR